MKTMLKVLFVVMLFMVGNRYIGLGLQNKVLAYYQENSVPLLKENKKDEYIESFMTASQFERYITKPIYSGISTDETFHFEFSVYNGIDRQGSQQSLFLYFDDRKTNETEQINYAKLANIDELDTRYVRVRADIILDDKELPVKYYFPIDLNYRLPVIAFRLNDDNQIVFKDINEKNQVQMATADQITKITLSVEYLKGSNKLDIHKKYDDIKFAELTHNDSNSLDNIDNFVETNDLFVSTSFNGKTSLYSKLESYKDETLVSYTNKDSLKPYNKYVRNPIIIFTSVSVVAVYFVFLFKPTLAFIDKKKQMKKINEREEKKQTQNIKIKDEIEVVESNNDQENLN